MTDDTDNGWKLYKVSDFAEVVGGGTPSTGDQTNFGEHIPWITPKDLSTHQSRYISRGERSLSAKGLSGSSAKRLPAGTVLVSSRAPIGLTALAQNDVSTNQGCRSLVLNTDLADSEFVYYLMTASTDYLHQHANGTTFMELSGGVFKTLEFMLPPLEDQRRIAAVLAALDDRIESCVSIARSCEHLLLAHFDRLQEQGDDTWHAAVMRDATRFVGGSTPSTSAPEYWSPETHLWATPRDLSRLSTPVVVDTERKISSQGRDQISSRLLPAGSVLLSSRAPIGYLAWLAEPAAINQGIIGFVPGGTLSPSFMYAWCKRFMDDIEGRAGGTTFAEISKTNFGTMPVLVPDDEALRRFDVTCAPLTDAMERESRELQSLYGMRSFLLPRLVSGELRVAAAEELVEAAT